MIRPQSGLIDGDYYMGFRSDVENESLSPAYKTRLYTLFRQIEKEFDLLYQENQNCKFGDRKVIELKNNFICST